MIDFLFRLLHFLLKRRDRRNPYWWPVTGRCAETNRGERCRLARGHLVQHLSATRTWPRANTCSVHCRPSCSYPKCEAPPEWPPPFWTEAGRDADGRLWTRALPNSPKEYKP